MKSQAPRNPKELSRHERRIVDAILNRTAISRDIVQDLENKRTFGERIADRIAGFGGSWTFILTSLALLTAWIVLNSASTAPFDPFPFILLNLALSMVAALQAPVILMSQNRQTERDRADASHDYEVNLKAELEIRLLHDKLDTLREVAWSELVEMQGRQIALLEQLLQAKLPATPPAAS